MNKQVMKGGGNYMSKKAVIYCRVASAEQTHSYSLEKQRLECTSFAQKNGYEVVEIVSEQGSGLRTNNQLQKVLNAIRTGRINTLIVSSMDRLGRNFHFIKKTISEVEMNKGEVKFSNEPDSPEKVKLFREISLGLSNYYAHKISLATKKGLAARKQRLAAAQSK